MKLPSTAALGMESLSALTSGSVCSYSYMKLDAEGLKDMRGWPKAEPSEESCH